MDVKPLAFIGNVIAVFIAREWVSGTKPSL
jgi:hypothetical protein